MKVKVIKYFFLGFTIGLAYWLLSPVLFGKYEPWDYSLTLYWIIISVAGLTVGLLAGKYFWISIIGIYFGQVIVAVLRPQTEAMENTPLLLGLFALALYSFPAILGALLGWGTKCLYVRKRKHNESN
jgi:predicted transporter